MSEINVALAEDFKSVCDTLARALTAKNADYGSSVFKTPVLKPSLSVESSIAVRISDKIERLANLLESNEQTKVSESLDDTIFDLAGYSVLWLVYRRRQNEVKDNA